MDDKKPILLVEDDEVDIMTIQRAIKDLNVTNNLVVTNNGEEALDYLSDPDKANPCIILLE